MRRADCLAVIPELRWFSDESQVPRVFGTLLAKSVHGPFGDKLQKPVLKGIRWLQFHGTLIFLTKWALHSRH
jgi:hypothetical protein